MIDCVVGRVEEHVDAGGSRFSESILEPCNCFTVECGSPGMLKSMSSSLISRLNALSVLIEQRNFTMYFRSMLFFHHVCA